MSIATIGKKFALTVQAMTVAFGFSAFSLAAVAVVPATAQAACTGTFNITNGADCAAPTGAKADLFATNGLFNKIANTLIFLVGAIAVLFLIIGGLRYVVSNGDAKNVEAAKNTILYAIVGIVVAILAYAAVKFVIGTLTTP